MYHLNKNLFSANKAVIVKKGTEQVAFFDVYGNAYITRNTDNAGLLDIYVPEAANYSVVCNNITYDCSVPEECKLQVVSKAPEAGTPSSVISVILAE